jgi:hypothetical protein
MEQGAGPEWVEITTYIRDEQAVASEMLEITRRQSAHPNYHRAALVQEARDLLTERYIVAIGVSKGKIIPRP